MEDDKDKAKLEYKQCPADTRWRRALQALVESELQTAACRVQMVLPAVEEENFVGSARAAWKRAQQLISADSYSVSCTHDDPAIWCNHCFEKRFRRG